MQLGDVAGSSIRSRGNAARGSISDVSAGCGYGLNEETYMELFQAGHHLAWRGCGPCTSAYRLHTRRLHRAARDPGETT